MIYENKRVYNMPGWVPGTAFEGFSDPPKLVAQNASLEKTDCSNAVAPPKNTAGQKWTKADTRLPARLPKADKNHNVLRLRVVHRSGIEPET